MDEPTGAVRCAAWARDERLNPNGTAGSYNGFTLLPLPLPWPADIAQHQGFRPQATGIRAQAVGGSETVRYTKPESPWFRTYETGDGRADLLICTHGSRDACCGSRGTRLYLDVREQSAVARSVRRTSHAGGHRFAPTAVLLPEGTLWAYLDVETIAAITARTGDPGRLVEHYRGCAGLSSPRVQALECAVFGKVGWDLFDCARRGDELGDGTVRLLVRDRRKTVTEWQADVRAGRTLSLPDCGKSTTSAKPTHEWAVSRLRISDSTRSA